MRELIERLEGLDERIGERAKEYGLDGSDRKKVISVLSAKYPKFKKRMGSSLTHLVPIPAKAIKSSEGEMISFRHMNSPDTNERGLEAMYRDMFGVKRGDVQHSRQGNWDFIVVVFPDGTLAKMLPGMKMEGVELEEAKINPAFIKQEVGISMQLLRSVKDHIDHNEMQSIGALGATLDRIAILTRGFRSPKFKKAAKLIDKAVEAMIEEE